MIKRKMSNEKQAFSVEKCMERLNKIVSENKKMATICQKYEDETGAELENLNRKMLAHTKETQKAFNSMYN